MQAQWQLIKTAPRDGRKILVAEASGRIVVARFDWLSVEASNREKGWARHRWIETESTCPDSEVTTKFYCERPTHWMPLPEPPSPPEAATDA
jgi:hypothetical protein